MRSGGSTPATNVALDPRSGSHTDILWDGTKLYVAQSHTLATPANDALRSSRDAGEAYDGITEVWFDDIESLGTTQDAMAAGQRLLEDERTFLDLSRSSLFLTVEHEIF